MDKLDNIKIPINIDLLTIEAINKGEKYKQKKAVKTRIFATAVVICLTFLMGVNSLRVSAKVKEFTGNVFREVKEFVGLRGKDENNEAINRTVTKKNVSITLQDVLCDEYGIYVSYIVKSDEVFKNTNDSQLLLYDEYSKTSFNKGNLDTGGIAGIEGKFIDEHTFIGVQSYLFNNLKSQVPEKFNLDIKIGAISLNSVKDDNVIEGNWKFSIPVTLNGDNIKVINPSIEYKNILIKKITLSRLNTFIEVEMPLDSDYDSVILTTDKGVDIDRISYEVKENGDKTTLIQRFKGIPDDVESLTLNFGDTGSVEVDIK